ELRRTAVTESNSRHACRVTGAACKQRAEVSPMLRRPLIEARRADDDEDADSSGFLPRVQSIVQGVDRTSFCRPIVGQSAAWKEVLTNATRVAATEATVLLHGDSGTGKEVVARFIHRASPRNHGPFVAINCAALPETLLES